MENQTQDENQTENPGKNSNSIGGEQVNKAISALQKPTSFLLFILMVILVLQGVQYYESVSKQRGLSALLVEVEKNRGAELQECGETIRYLTEKIGDMNQ